MEQTNVCGTFPNFHAANQSTPPDRTQSAALSPHIAQSLSYASGDTAPEETRPRYSLRDPRAAYANAVTTFQQALRTQVSLRSGQLAEHVHELASLHARSDAVLAEYANEVCSAQSRTNRALLDTQQLLQDVDRTIADSRASLGLPSLAVATAPVTPHYQSASAPPELKSATLSSSLRTHVEQSSIENPSDLPPGGSDSRSQQSGLLREPDESIDDYDARIGRAARQQGRIAQAMRPSVSQLAREVGSTTASATASSRVRDRDPPPPVSAQDPYMPYRGIYRQTLEEQYVRARQQLEEFELRARMNQPPPNPHGTGEGNFAAPTTDYGPSVRFQHPLPSRSISDARVLNAHRNQPLPIYTSGQPISVIQSAAGESIAPRNGAPVNPHLDGLLRQVILNIHHKVGQPRPPLPEGAKQPKIEMPDKYSGTNDHQEFYRWLDGVLIWMRAYNLCGPDADAHRIQYLRQHLSKEAAEWYTQEVDHPSVETIPTFEDTVCAMHARFIHSNTAAKATEEFTHCTYSQRGGVEKFAEELKRRAKEMIAHPNDYEMRIRLFHGLPKRMITDLQVHRGVSPEYCTWDTILEHARQLEDAYRRTDTSDTLTHRSSLYPSAMGQPTTSRPMDRNRDHRDRSRSLSRGRQTERERDRSEHRRGRDERSHYRDRDRHGRPPSKTRFPPHPPTPGATTAKDNACFVCGKVGHFKGDPQCPKAREVGQSTSASRPKPRFHAQRVEPEAEDENKQDDQRNRWGGSQYSDDEPTSDGLQSEPEGEDDASEIIRAHAMRIIESEMNSLPRIRSMRVTVEDVPDIEDSRGCSDDEWASCESKSDKEAEPVRLQAMRTTKGGAPIESRSTVRRRDQTSSTAQPDRDPAQSAVLSAMIEIAGHTAYTMFDSGSTTSAVTPEYSHIARTPKVVLEDQVVLQLGCSGSRSKINFGTHAPVSFGPLKGVETYLDIVNLDRYDCVLGTPFMNEHGMMLDFKTREIVIQDHRIAAFTHEEDVAFCANRRRTQAGKTSLKSS